MAWVQAFPTGATLISQSVQQIQDNWLFLQTNINTDHYFNSGAPNEGHHRFVQLVNQAGDPVVAVDGVIYAKPTTSGSIQPYYSNTSYIKQIPLMVSGTAAIGGGGGAFAIENLAGKQAFCGIISCFLQGGITNCVLGYVVWTGATLEVLTVVAHGTLTAIGVSGLTSIAVTSTGAGTVTWNYLAFIN